MLFGIAKSIITQPKLLVLLFASCKKTIFKEFRGVIRAMKIRFILYVLSILFLGLGLMSCIGSLLLWAALPLLNSHNAWVMIFLPLLLFFISFLFYLSGNRLKIRLNFLGLSQTIKLNTEHICKSLTP